MVKGKKKVTYVTGEESIRNQVFVLSAMSDKYIFDVSVTQDEM